MPGDEARAYRQRRPEKTVLYRLIQQHLESFLEHVHDASGKRLPKYVENEFRRYLECGLHAYGFARAVCETLRRRARATVFLQAPRHLPLV